MSDGSPTTPAVPPEPAPAQPLIEPGYQTTEFQASVLVSIIVLLQPVLHIGLTLDQATELITALWTIYTVGRSIRKKS